MSKKHHYPKTSYMAPLDGQVDDVPYQTQTFPTTDIAIMDAVTPKANTDAPHRCCGIWSTSCRQTYDLSISNRNIQLNDIEGIEAPGHRWSVRNIYSGSFA